MKDQEGRMSSPSRLPACPSCDRRKLALLERKRRLRGGERYARCTCGADVRLMRKTDDSPYFVAAFRPNRPLSVYLVCP